MQCPAYFEEIRRRSSSRWDQLESDPELAGPWHQLFKQVQSPRHVLSELLQNADDAGATETSVPDRRWSVLSLRTTERTSPKSTSHPLCRFGYSEQARPSYDRLPRVLGSRALSVLVMWLNCFTPTLSAAFHREPIQRTEMA